MRHLLFSSLFAILTSFASSQQLLPSNLPQCAAQCTVLQQGQTSCVPAGGAPQASQQTYQSCFCQSALLTQLYQAQPVQLCNTCDSGDMQTIQNWYKNFCGQGGAPLPGGNQNAQNSNNNQQQQATTTKTGPTQTPTSQSSSSHHSASAENKEPWMSTHWRWVVMLIVIFFGLIAIAVLGYFLHRRYHRKRMSKWSTGPGSQPNISTWGPGQSVHDLGFQNRQEATSGDAEKGAAASAATPQEPQRAATGPGDGEKSGGRRSRPWSRNFF